MSYPSYMGLYLVHVAIKPYKVDPGLHPVAIKAYKVDPVLHLSLPFFFYLKYLKLHTRFFLGSTHPSRFLLLVHTYVLVYFYLLLHGQHCACTINHRSPPAKLQQPLALQGNPVSLLFLCFLPFASQVNYTSLCTFFKLSLFFLVCFIIVVHCLITTLTK